MGNEPSTTGPADADAAAVADAVAAAAGENASYASKAEGFSKDPTTLLRVPNKELKLLALFVPLIFPSFVGADCGFGTTV